tara:strand:+ start:5915 stop:6934 length:1020 start_codon:yes stop_codon:yes gene_type:complete
MLLCLLAAGCSRDAPQVELSGASMGTTWHLSYVPTSDTPTADAVEESVQRALDAVNASMSTYQQDSEISRFNRAPGESWVSLSAEFMQVLDTALEVGAQSAGAYDVTVAPLVDLWGFGPVGALVEPPAPEAIEHALSRVGQTRIQTDPEGMQASKPAGVSLDFSSIAKGFAVDQAALALRSEGVSRFLLEVGGEMALSGLSGRGDPWRVAIEDPASTGREVAAVLSITDIALATSGEYRNYFEYDGQRYSHSIDPRSGWPVAHDLVSVTVVHESAMLADAWATALIVLGAAEAPAVAESKGLAVYFIRRGAEGLIHSHTSALEQHLPDSERARGPGDAL